jgi:hypothetical protein
MMARHVSRIRPALLKPCLAALALLSMFASARLFAQADAPARTAVVRDSVSVAVLAATGESASFADSFADSLANSLLIEFGAKGFRQAGLYKGPLDGSMADTGIAASVHNGDGSRWVAVVRCSIERKRLVWRATVFDSIDGAMIAAEAQGAFAGLTALPLLGQSAAKVAQDTAALRTRVAPGMPISYRLRFVSGDEGANVAFGTGDDSRPAGAIENGALTAPFVAFRAGDPVVVSMARDGYWPRTAVFRTTESDEPIELPALMPRTRQAVSGGISATRILGLSADYRYYLSPDSIFLRAGDSLWAQAAFTPGSIPVWHDELRIGAGAYLFTPRHARFRFAAGSGISWTATWVLPADVSPNLYYDVCLDAVWMSFEWHTPAWAVFMEQRISYSFGLDSGLLNRGWLESGMGPMTLTLGVMRKWP